jgi:tol-pal system protein YbgF
MVGCRAADNHQETIAALEREVTRLKAERANLDSRSTTLDDKILVLEKRLEKCEYSENRGLRVVRLTREDEEAFSDAEGEVQPKGEARDTDVESGGRQEKRPHLVLKSTLPRPARSSRSNYPVQDGVQLRGASRSDFRSLGPDNLGVVAGTEQPSIESEMDLFNDGYKAYTNKEYDSALSLLASFVNGHSSHPYADNAVYWRGECYLAMGKLPNAIGEFERLTRRYPQSEKVPAAIFKIGFVYDKMRDYGKAVDFYFDVVERYPGSNEARRASRRVAEIRNSTGNVSGLLPTSGTR